MFAMEVRKDGAVKTGHQLMNKFVTSVKKITSSVDEIPDDELKENFMKFRKV